MVRTSDEDHSDCLIEEGEVGMNALEEVWVVAKDNGEGLLSRQKTRKTCGMILRACLVEIRNH